MRWLALLVTIAVAGCGAWAGANREPRFDYEWECQPDDPQRPVPMTCSFSAVSGSGFVCGVVVVMCGRRRHEAKLCSGMLDGTTTRRVSVSQLTPALDDPATCDRIRFEPQVTQ